MLFFLSLLSFRACLSLASAQPPEGTIPSTFIMFITTELPGSLGEALQSATQRRILPAPLTS